MWPKEDCCICPIPFSWIWTPFAAMCLLKLWFFMNLLLKGPTTSAIGFSIPQTQKYVPLKAFQCIFPGQNQQNVKYLPETVIFQEPLEAETWNLWYWMWHASNLNMHHSSHFNALFPVKINKMWNFCLKLWFFLELLIAQTQNLWH